MFSDVPGSCHWFCAAALLLGWLTGCASQPPRARTPVDLSTPKAAAATFLQAIAQGDARTARQASMGTEQQKQWIDAMVGFVDGLRSYDKALIKRFGREAIPTDVDIRQTLLTTAEEPARQVQDAIIDQTDDTARLLPAYKGIRLMAQPPMILRRQRGQWKIDLAATAQVDHHHDPEITKQYLTAGKALHETARQIAAGRFKTIDEAQEGAMQ